MGNENHIYSAFLVGTGRIGFSLGFDEKREQPASHTAALLQNGRTSLIAGCDICAANLSSWQNYVGQKAFSSSDEMYASGLSADIIVIAVNEDAHLSECLKAFEQKPRLVILEKPVALNSKEAFAILQAARQSKTPVLVNHERRFSADYNFAAAYMKKIGSVQKIRAELCSSLRVYSPKNEADGAYSLLHDGTHLADIVCFFLEQLFAESAEKNGSDLSDLREAILLKNPCVTGFFADGDHCVRNFAAHYTTQVCPDVEISISGRSRFFSFGIDILGTEGRVCVGNGYADFYARKESSLYTGFYSLEKDLTVNLPRKTGYFANMVQNAVDFLDGKAPLKSSLETAIKDLLILEAIKEKLSALIS